MTSPIVLVLGILTLAIVFFVKDWLRVDLVALLVLLSLTLTGQISHTEALSGFSNPAVITIASVLVLSGGLMRTGVANVVGRYVLLFSGKNETRLLVGMMATVGLLSGVMNNIGVAALMLPVVLDIARRIKRPPSKLLIPLAFGSLLGGLTTLIGTSPNILLSAALEERGLAPFELFDFTPLGLIVLVSGIVYMVLFGRHLLPSRDPVRESSPHSPGDLTGFYRLDKILFSLTLPVDSALSGKTLAESRLRLALGLNVLAISRNGRMILSPGPGEQLLSGDKLLVEGVKENLEALKEWKHFVMEPAVTTSEQFVSGSIEAVEVVIRQDSSLVGRTLVETGLRNTYGVTVLAILRDQTTYFRDLLKPKLKAGDTLLVLGEPRQLRKLADREGSPIFWTETGQEVFGKYKLDRLLLRARLPKGSALEGKALRETRFGEVFGLTVVGIIRDSQTRLLPDPEELLLSEDVLLIQGRPQDLEHVEALQELQLNERDRPTVEELESQNVKITEVTLSPRTTLAGKTLRELYFREKFGLTVLAIWREGKIYLTDLGKIAIKLGDALLIYGRSSRIAMLARDPDFLVLTEVDEETLRKDKAPLAITIEIAVLCSVVIGWLPIYIAAPSGACLMVLTGCLTMDEVYRFIEWQAVVLIAGMLSLGHAMQSSGAAAYLADHVLGLVGELGPVAVAAGVFAVACLSAQVIPTAAVPVLMAPIALSSAEQLGLSPQALMMAVAVACSSAFLSPIGHPANLLVMGVGGYRFTDYTKVGVPLVLMMLLIVIFILPLLWPLTV